MEREFLGVENSAIITKLQFITMSVRASMLKVIEEPFASVREMFASN